MKLRLLASGIALITALASGAIANTVQTTPFLPNNRLLVVLDALTFKDNYSQLWKSLQGRGYELTVKQAGDSSIALDVFGERSFEHLILFAPKVKEWGPKLNPRSVIEFVKSGGNLVVSIDSGFHESWRELAFEFGIDFDDRDTLAIDHFKFDAVNATAASHTRLAVTAVNAKAAAIVGEQKPEAQSPILYQGIAHRIVDESPLAVSVLSGEQYTYSYEVPKSSRDAGKVDSEPLIAGRDVSLVSAVQARNNARAVFTGGLKLFSDEFASAPAQQKGSKLHKSSGNARFVEDLTKWVFQEKSVLRVASVHHNKVGETEQPDHYRIKDDFTYAIKLEEYRDKKWHPFAPNDAQLELIMLDPYVRRTLNVTEKKTTLTTTLTLPDVYGVFTLRVNYKRPGYSYIDQTTSVPVHPFRHDEYPRFLSQAFPYYASAGSMAIGFLLLSVMWMFYKEPVVVVKDKKTS